MHHHGQQDAFVLGHLVGDDHEILRLLAVLGEDLNPAAVAVGHDIRVVVPDVNRSGEGAVGHYHHDRQTQSGCDEEDFVHQRQALRGGGGEGTSAGCRSATASAQCGVLGLHRNKLSVEFAVGDQLGEVFHHVGLRRDRISRDAVHIASRDCLGDGDGDFDSFTFSH